MSEQYERMSEEELAAYHADVKRRCGNRPSMERLIVEELAALRAYVGSEMLHSDFQTATQMRAALNALRASVLRIATACDNCTSLSELQDWARDALKGVPLPEGPCSPVVCEKLERLEAKVARARERITECVEIYGGTAHLSLGAFDAELGTGAQDKIQIPSDAEKLRNCICELLDEMEKDPDGPADGTEFDAIIRARLLVPEWQPSAMREEGGGDGN